MELMKQLLIEGKQCTTGMFLIPSSQAPSRICAGVDIASVIEQRRNYACGTSKLLEQILLGKAKHTFSKSKEQSVSPKRARQKGQKNARPF